MPTLPLVAFTDDQVTEIIQTFNERMTITGALPGPTNLQIVTTTSATELQAAYDDLNKQLYTDHDFTTYGLTTYQFTGGDTPHQFTFNVGDYRNEPQPTV